MNLGGPASAVLPDRLGTVSISDPVPSGCTFTLVLSFDAYTYLVDVLQRISVHPANRAIELTPRMWKSLFADAPMRSDLGPHHHDPPSHCSRSRNHGP